ncbi:MAG: FHA domain-containing protein [bacterium]|nr:FHA domain-containing protein [bacterium]
MNRKLLVVNPDQCLEAQFEQQITIGRDAFNALCLQDPETSRSHAIIFEQEGRTILKDLNSRNGCYVRGEKTPEAILQPGDEIIIGSTVLLFDPPEDLDLDKALTKRGKFVLEKRAKRPSEHQAPPTAFTCEEVDGAIEKLFSEPDKTSFFSLTNAVMLLQAVREMDRAAHSAGLFECAVRHALRILGGHRGVVMESDEGKDHLKVRSILAADDTKTIVIGQPVLRVVLGAEKCVYCANIHRDKNFARLVAKDKRPIFSFVASPIRLGDELFGFIYLDAEDESISYDYASMRSLYLIASHVGALLRARPMHFSRHPAAHSVARPS